ncbi:MAG TPA: hypothetical protein PLF63_04030 [Rubrivivax sp.]|jgi:hypothetical protein|nr:hypothetical protein [Rubrivivax sp.]
MSMDPIDHKARVYADARQALADAVAALNEAQTALQRDHLPTIKRLLNKAFKHENELRGLVQANPHLFVRPRTAVLHGIKVGFEKGKGQVLIQDPAQCLALITKKLPELADALVITERRPSKAAIAQLSVAQLKAIGCSVSEADDRVVVRAVDSAVDKLVAALLKAIGDEAAASELADAT